VSRSHQRQLTGTLRPSRQSGRLRAAHLPAEAVDARWPTAAVGVRLPFAEKISRKMTRSETDKLEKTKNVRVPHPRRVPVFAARVGTPKHRHPERPGEAQEVEGPAFVFRWLHNNAPCPILATCFCRKGGIARCPQHRNRNRCLNPTVFRPANPARQHRCYTG
jgi:hypothetical protein